MGLFSTKKKTVIGVQSFDLGTDGYASFADFRHNAAFASGGNARAYQKAIYDYKKSVKSSYSSKRLDRYGMDPVSTPYTYSYSQMLTDLINSRDDIYAVEDLRNLENNLTKYSVIVNSGSLTKESKISSSPDFTIEVQAFVLAELCVRGHMFPDYIPCNINTIRYEYSDFYETDCFRIGYNSDVLDDNDWIGIEIKLTKFEMFTNDEVVDNVVNGTILARVSFDAQATSENLRVDGTSTTEGYSIYTGNMGTHIENDSDTHNFGCFPTSQDEHLKDDYPDNEEYPYLHSRRRQETDYSWNEDIGYFYFAGIQYATNIASYSEQVYRPLFGDRLYYLAITAKSAVGSITTVNGAYEAEPLLNIKDHSKSLEEIEEDESGMTDEERAEYRKKRFYNKKIIKSFSVDLDSFEAQIQNDTIKEMSVGMIFDFSKVGKSQSVLHTLYNSLHSILPTDLQVISPEKMDDGYYPANPIYRMSLDMPFGSGTITTSFVLQRRTYAKVIDYNPERFSIKVKAKADEYNSVRNRDDAVELYEDYFGAGTADGKTTLELRTEVIAEYNATDTPSEELETAFSLFPSKKSCMDIYDITFFTGHLNVEPTSANDALVKLTDLGAGTEGYTAIMFKARRVPNSSPYEYFKMEKLFGKLVGTRALGEIGSGLNTVYKIQKEDSGMDEVVEYIISDIFMHFSDGTYSSNRLFNQGSDSGTDLFLPAASGTLNSMKFYDYIEAKDVLLSGVVFTVQVIKIKWYQQKWFAWVLIVVAIVIAIISLGSATSISSALITLATEIIVAMAVAKAIEVIAPMLGIDPNDVRLVVALVSIVYGDASAALKLLQLADALMKRELQEELDKLKNIKNDMKKFKEEQDKLMRLAESDSDSSKAPALWAIVDRINNAQKDGKLYTLDELEYMEEIEKYSVPFKPIYIANPSKALLDKVGIPPNTMLY